MGGVGLAVMVAAAMVVAAPTAVERVSVSAAGVQGDRDSGSPSISADGRYVAFASSATTLVPGDTNGTPDIFVADRRTGTVTRADVSSRGAQAHHLTDEGSFGPSISADGRFVAFASFADNLVPGDTNEALDGFVHDNRTGRTIRVTLDAAGGQAFGGGVSISGDGSRVAFVSTPANIIPGSTDTFDAVFVRDLRTGAVSRVDVSTAGDPPQGISGVALISGDGRHVVFQSYGSGLDPGDVNDDGDVFVRDLDTGVTRMVSVTPAGLSGNGVSGGFAVSADGRYVAFQSYASDLVPGDTNGVPDAFVRDMRTGVTRLVSVAAGGGPADGYGSSPTAVSADGRFVAFQSYASDLVPGDTNGMLDAFVRDMRAGTTTRVSVDGRGAQADGASAGAAMTADARWLAFGSSATNLVPGDTNGVADVFARRR